MLKIEYYASKFQTIVELVEETLVKAGVVFSKTDENSRCIFRTVAESLIEVFEGFDEYNHHMVVVDVEGCHSLDPQNLPVLRPGISDLLVMLEVVGYEDNQRAKDEESNALDRA